MASSDLEFELGSKMKTHKKILDNGIIPVNVQATILYGSYH
jgi:hypothetical protein